MVDEIPVKIKFVAEGMEDAGANLKKNLDTQIGGMGGLLEKTAGGLPGIGGVMKAGVAGGAIAGGIMAGVSLLQKIAGFVMDLAPMKVILELFRTILMLIFLPFTLMLMTVLLPFLIFFLNLFRGVNMANLVKYSQQVANSMLPMLTSITNDIAPYIPTLLTAVQPIASLIGELLPLLATISLALAPLATLASMNNKLGSMMSNIGGLLSESYGLSGAIGGLKIPLVALKTDFENFWAWITGGFKSGWSGLTTNISDVKNAIVNFWNWIVGSVQTIWTSLVDALKGIDNFLKSLPHLATGGNILSNTVAVLHAGETVVPKGRVMNNGTTNTNQNITININAKVSNDGDMNKLANKIKEILSNDRRRIGTW